MSVEGSGRMGDQLGAKNSMGNNTVVGDAVNRSEAGVNGDVLHKPQPNGGSAHPTSAKPSTPGAELTREPKPDGPELTSTSDGATDGPSDVSPEGLLPTAEKGTSKTPQSNPKDQAAVGGGATLGDETTGLGPILKGSPFEKEKAKKASPSGSSKATATVAPPRSPKKHTKAPVNSSVNGKPKETQSPKPAPPPKAKAAPSSAPAAPLAAPKFDSPPESSQTPKATESKPDGVPETQPATPIVASNTKDTTQREPRQQIEPGPRTPNIATASGKQSTPKEASPKSAPARDPKELAKDNKKPIHKTSAASKPAPGPSSKPSKPAPSSGSSVARPVNKPDKTSPKQPFSKPRPKSPTRPVRLPAAATALTAAAAAKVDGSPPSHVAGKHPPNPAKPLPKPTRTSLPAGPKPVDKPKAFKPRTSMASSKAPEGSFLERMMRPTQSSSQKTHDKAPKAPQSKHQGTKPKRMSEGSDKSKTEHGDTKAELSEEPASEVKVPAESGENPSSIGASLLPSVAAHTIPATNPAP